MSGTNEQYWAWEPDAFALKPVPEGLSIVDQMTYTSLRNTVIAFRSGKIDAATATHDKKVLHDEWEKWNRAYTIEKGGALNCLYAMSTAFSVFWKCILNPSAEEMEPINQYVKDTLAGDAEALKKLAGERFKQGARITDSSPGNADI